MQGDLGELTVATPRDRDGTSEPQLIGKHQGRLTGFDEKILALYAKGMTTRDIQEIVQQLYGVEVSATLVSEITADLDAEVTVWRTRPLESVCCTKTRTVQTRGTEKGPAGIQCLIDGSVR